MNRTIAICVLVGWCVIWAVSVLAAPWALSDSNKFFANFVNHELLGFMGVLVTITLSSAANLFITLNALEDKVDAAVFSKTKRNVKSSAYHLIGSLIAAFALVALKPLVAHGPQAEAATNGVAVGIVLYSILILIDLMQAAFGLDPRP